MKTSFCQSLIARSRCRQKKITLIITFLFLNILPDKTSKDNIFNLTCTLLWPWHSKSSILFLTPYCLFSMWPYHVTFWIRNMRIFLSIEVCFFLNIFLVLNQFWRDKVKRICRTWITQHLWRSRHVWWFRYDLDWQCQIFQFCFNSHKFFHLWMYLTHTWTQQLSDFLISL